MRELETSLDLCTFCPRLCSDRCPVALVEARDTVTPQAKMAAFGRLRAGLAPWTPETTAALYACTGCGACASACKHGVEPGLRLLQGRAEAQDHAVNHPALVGLISSERRRVEELGAVLRSAELTLGLGVTPEFVDAAPARSVGGSPDGERSGPAGAGAAAAPEERGLATSGSVGAGARAAQRVAYLPACHGGPEGALADARRALRLCGAVADPGEAGPEVLSVGCGGYPLYAAGQVEAFRLHAEGVSRLTEGFDEVVTSCAQCAWLLAEQYPAHGVPLRGRVRHISEHLAPRASRLPVTRPLESAVYHDPCHLGRRRGVYDEPRQLLQRAVARAVEFPEHRDAAGCCGAGGLLPLTAPATALGMAAERLGQLAELPAEPGRARVVVTACSGCQGALAGAAGEGIRVVDLLTLLDEALG